MPIIPARAGGTRPQSTHSVPRREDRPSWLKAVKDAEQYPIDTASDSAYALGMIANHGLVERPDVARMVNAATVGGRVDARALAARLNALVNPSDPIEAARIAWESVKRDWRKEWPAPIRLELSDDSERDIGRRLLVVAVVRRSPGWIDSYEAIETAITDALCVVGVGLELRVDIRVRVRVVGE